MLSKPVNPRCFLANDDYNLLITTATKAVRTKTFSKQANAAVCGYSLPPLEYPSKKTVVLDLDETLIHLVKGTGDGSIRPKIYDFVFQGRKRVYHVLKRPFVDEFLQCLSDYNFEIVVFTAGTKRYASRVLDILDPRGLITHRLYRDSCKGINGGFIKDLSCLGRDLRKVVIVDDKPISYSLHPKNAIPIKPFTDDLHDDELMNLMGYFCENRDELFFKKFEKTNDYRNGNLQRLKVQKLFFKSSKKQKTTGMVTCNDSSDVLENNDCIFTVSVPQPEVT